MYIGRGETYEDARRDAERQAADSESARQQGQALGGAIFGCTALVALLFGAATRTFSRCCKLGGVRGKLFFFVFALLSIIVAGYVMLGAFMAQNFYCKCCDCGDMSTATSYVSEVSKLPTCRFADVSGFMGFSLSEVKCHQTVRENFDGCSGLPFMLYGFPLVCAALLVGCFFATAFQFYTANTGCGGNCGAGMISYLACFGGLASPCMTITSGYACCPVCGVTWTCCLCISITGASFAGMANELTNPNPHPLPPPPPPKSKRDIEASLNKVFSWIFYLC